MVDSAVERPIYPVTEEDVDRQIESLRGEYARIEKVDGRGIKQGDVVIAEKATGFEASLRERGYTPIGLDLSELLRGGGGVKCCTLELRGER